MKTLNRQGRLTHYDGTGAYLMEGYYTLGQLEQYMIMIENKRGRNEQSRDVGFSKDVPVEGDGA